VHGELREKQENRAWFRRDDFGCRKGGAVWEGHEECLSAFRSGFLRSRCHPPSGEHSSSVSSVTPWCISLVVHPAITYMHPPTRSFFCRGSPCPYNDGWRRARPSASGPAIPPEDS
jgi:hypothetical protein